MDTFWGLSATAWTAIYTLLTLGLLLVAVIAAAYAKRQWNVARQTQLEASRPYVIVTAESSAASRRLFDLSIRNIGKRPAINVQVSLDPPPTRAKEIDGHEFAMNRPACPETWFFDSSACCCGLLLSVVDLLENGRGHVPGVLVEPAVVVPVDPPRGGDLDRVHIPPGALATDHLGLVQPVDALGQRSHTTTRPPRPTV